MPSLFSMVAPVIPSSRKPERTSSIASDWLITATSSCMKLPVALRVGLRVLLVELPDPLDDFFGGARTQ